MAGQEDTSMGELAHPHRGLYVCSVCRSIPCVGPELILSNATFMIAIVR